MVADLTRGQTTSRRIENAYGTEGCHTLKKGEEFVQPGAIYQAIFQPRRVERV